MTENVIIHQRISASITKPAVDIELKRPNYVSHDEILSEYTCAICKDIPVCACQTPCGNRVCEACIEGKFNGSSVIPCPLPHDDVEDDDDLEECQKFGLRREDVTIDHSIRNTLLKQPAFCTNQPYGCRETPLAKKLLDHKRECRFYPQKCPNPGCSAEFASPDLSIHIQKCGYVMVHCQFCNKACRRKNLEEHVQNCEFAESTCTNCNRKYGKRKHLYVHQRTDPNCLMDAGPCFYQWYCGFSSDNIEELRAHLRDNTYIHLEGVTVKVNDLEQSKSKASAMEEKNIKQMVHDKVLPIEKLAAYIAVKTQQIESKLKVSESNADQLVNSMKTVSHCSHQIESASSRVNHIEKQIRDSGLDRVTVIEAHTQNLKRHADQILAVEKRLGLVNDSCDGGLSWRINNYMARKTDAIKGRKPCIFSKPFYTSAYGYKMCCRAYLSGDGLGRGTHLSLFFVLMKGEYDELLSFPFKQKVTLSLICHTNQSNSKHQTFLPDADSASFRRPQTNMNVASGIPQFALHSEVESSLFLVHDCIYIRVRVEPGGDIIP